MGPVEMGRRAFLELCGAGASLAVPPVAHFSPEKKLFSVFGLHGTPDVGGGLNPNQTVDDMDILGAGTLLAIDPSEELLKMSARNRIRVITRAFLPANKFYRDSLDLMMRKATKYIPNPVVQPYNEVNLSRETGGIPRSPEEHLAEDFLPAAEIIAAHDGIVLLTPLAQKAQEDDLKYLEIMLTELHKTGFPVWLADRLALGVHSYIFNQGENAWTRILDIHRMTQDILGVSLPIYITEAGLHQEKERSFDPWVVSEETVRLLNEPIPPGPQIGSFCFWVLSNFAQRPLEHQVIPYLHDYELSAWRGLQGPRSVYYAVQTYALGLRF